MSEQVSKTQRRVEEGEVRLVRVMGEEDLPGDLEARASVRAGDHRGEGVGRQFHKLVSEGFAMPSLGRGGEGLAGVGGREPSSSKGLAKTGNLKVA